LGWAGVVVSLSEHPGFALSRFPDLGHGLDEKGGMTGFLERRDDVGLGQPAVELLGHGSHLPRGDDGDDAGPLQGVHVMSHRALGSVHGFGELLDAGGPLGKQLDDVGAVRIGQQPGLFGVQQHGGPGWSVLGHGP
jgi:hypothetical protein